VSFLTPLYALGLAVLAAPVIFHLIRRSPRGQVPFSSLLYLSPTPPRLTRWSRLDNLFLLLLRAIALGLLVAAFTRPFLREEARYGAGGDERRLTALLIDTSASMHRGELWREARARADEVIAACRPGEEIAVFSFDRATHALLGFEESATLDLARRQALARAQVDRLEPSWGGTNLGQALIDAVAAVVDAPHSSENSALTRGRVVLISDLQQGSHLEALGEFEWPADVELELRAISDSGSNASLHMLAEPAFAAGLGGRAEHRVRVFNDASSRREEFELSWVDEKGAAVSKAIPVYVPPGESRVVRVPRPAPGQSSRRLCLRGDTRDFDNTLFVADEQRNSVKVVFLGPNTVDDPAGLFYYVQRAYAGSAERSVEVVSESPQAAFIMEPSRPPALVILASETTPGNIQQLKRFAQEGGTLLYVALAPGPAVTLAGLADVAPWNIEEAPAGRDVMLSEIAFDSTLFAPLAGAQFNDFTKIRFWKHRRCSADNLGAGRVLARFEGGDPALIEKSIGKGTLLFLASGWQPADSQLARSSKFVPLLTALLDGRSRRPAVAASYTVGAPVPLPAAVGATTELSVHRPDGTTVKISPEKTVFSATDVPGVYSLETPEGRCSFAVNLDPAESKTAPLHGETLEQFGCRLVSPSQKKIDQERLRQMHNIELEERQKLWRLLILAVIGVLIVETLVAGRLGVARQPRAEALTR
jgi:Aerotolerance regulator N-terminal/von Willebrand factor type A domain